MNSKALECFLIPEVANENIGKTVKQLLMRKDEKKLSKVRSEQLINQYHDDIWNFMAVFTYDIIDLCKKYNTEAMYYLDPLITTNMKLDSKLSGNNGKKFTNQWYSTITIGGYDYDSKVHSLITNDLNIYFSKWYNLAVKYLPDFRLMHLADDKNKNSIHFILVYNEFINYDEL